MNALLTALVGLLRSLQTPPEMPTVVVVVLVGVMVLLAQLDMVALELELGSLVHPADPVERPKANEHPTDELEPELVLAA